MKHKNQCPKEENTPVWKKALDAVQGILACCAIIAAGWWFLFSDQAGGKANCSQKLSMVEITSEHTNVWWCSLEVRMENVGERPLRISNARLIVEGIKPQPDNFKLEFNENEQIYKWGKAIFDHHETDYTIDRRILPGEVDFQYFEFTMPTNVQVFRIYTHINKTTRDFYGWAKNSIYEMKDHQPVEIPETEK